MTRRARVALGVYLVLFAVAASAFHFGNELLGDLLAVPLALLTGWAFLGHLITLDDELPGGWSNPGHSRVIWHRSLAELMLKMVFFATSVWLLLQKW